MLDGVEIQFSDSLTEAQRELAEQSISAMVERGRTEAAAARARSAEEDKLRDAISAPLAKLVQADPAAVAALRKLSKIQIESDDDLHMEGPVTAPRSGGLPGPSVFATTESRLPPYDFAWRWHHGAGAPPFDQRGGTEGSLGLIARSGSWIASGADRFVSAHIGVGCIVRADRPVSVKLFAPRALRHSYIVGAHGISGSATSEGGLETTFMRGNEVLMGGTTKLWRRRAGANEESRDQTGWTNDVYPNGMSRSIGPGDYAYNVGIWAFADHSSGVGNAGAESLVQSNILEMRFNLWA
jgi:hypothetical protein